MKILAIETVGRTGSVAALDGERVLAELALESQRRSAQMLAPTMAQLLAEIGWQPRDVQLVAVAEGPGSFTGLRIGVTTAKAFAYAVGCEIVGVPTLLAIAWRAPQAVSRLTVVLDAERRELFVGSYERGPSGEMTVERETRIESEPSWLASLRPGDVVSGPGLQALFDSLPEGVVALERSLWNPTAASVGQAGYRIFARDQESDAFTLLPQYYRKTVAEERAK